MPKFDYTHAHLKLENIGEEHLLKYWNNLTKDQQEILLGEIQLLDIDTFKLQQQVLKIHLKPQIDQVAQSWEPFCDYTHAGSESHLAFGKQLIAEGKVGCLLVAGGQGTRLSYEAPKGAFPVSVIKKKSLFQIFAEKTIAGGIQVNRKLPLAIMTSQLNHTATLDFFRINNNFGLAENQLFFFAQDDLPFLDDQGHLFLQHSNMLAKGPDGNGNSLKHFVKSGIWENWNNDGVEYLNYILIDNPLADPFDAELIGFHAAKKNAITIKCVERNLPDERVGLLVKTDKGISIIEYSEMNDPERHATLSDGKLKHRCTNISLFCFSMEFIKKSIETNMPWHLASKPAYLNGPLAWKFETFIFDYLATTNAAKALLYPREQVFAPLKNGSGTDSLETVQKALINQDISTLERICGHAIPFCPLELEQQYHYPTEELLSKWKGHPGPFKGYITQH